MKWGKRMGSAIAKGGVSFARLAAIVEAYGGRPERWPADERKAALALIETDRNVQEIVGDGLRLDKALDTVPGFVPSRDLKARILRDFEIARKRHEASQPVSSRFVAMTERVRDYVWPGAPIWTLASALAVSLVIGLVAGSIIPSALGSRDDNDQLLVLDSGPSLGQEI